MLKAAKTKLRTNVKDRVSRAVETTKSTAGTGTVNTGVHDAQNVAQLGHSAVDTAQSAAVGLVSGGVASSGASGAHDQVVEDDTGHEGEEHNRLATGLSTQDKEPIIESEKSVGDSGKSASRSEKSASVSDKSASDTEDFLKTGHWTWSDEVKQQYMDAISRHPMIKVDSGEALNSATKIYTEPAIKQVLLFNTTEGEFLLNGLQTGPNVTDTIKCSPDFDNSVLEKTVFQGYNLRNGYKNTTTTTIQNEDIPSEIKGFSFVNGPCNPCAAVNKDPDYTCKFKLDIPLNTFRNAFL